MLGLEARTPPDIYIPPEPQPAKLVSSWRFASKCKAHSNVKSQLGELKIVLKNGKV